MAGRIFRRDFSGNLFERNGNFDLRSDIFEVFHRENAVMDPRTCTVSAGLFCVPRCKLCHQKNAHIRITFIGQIMPSFLRNSFEIIGHLCFITFCAILIFWGIPLCNDIKNFNQVSAALRLPMYIPYLALPMGGIIMTYRLIQKICQIFSGNSQ